MLIQSTIIKDYFNKGSRKAQGIFPQLISRLMRLSINTNGYIHFPNGDAIFTTGSDGVLTDVNSKDDMVPEGNSIWEIGTNKDGLTKIKNDYNKRKASEEIFNKGDYSYVAVTSAILDSTKKQSFCDKAINDKIFKKVQVLDANDIAEWLNRHIDVWVWLLKESGKEIEAYDIRLLKDEWEYLLNGTEPNLTHKNFLVGNESNSLKFVDDLIKQENNRLYTIASQYYGRDQAYYFALASLMGSSNVSLIERCIIVNSQAALNYINAFCKNKIVLVNFNCQDDRFAAQLNNTYVFFDTSFSDYLELSPMNQNEFIDSIVQLGIDYSDACRYAYLSGYNILSLKRLFSKAPLAKVPKWFRDRSKNQLIPLVLMGEIKMDEKADVLCLKGLVGEDYDSYLEQLNYWAELPETPVFKYGNFYRTCARKECFDFIQIDVYSLKLQRLETILKKALSEVNNKFERDSSDWCVNDGSYIWRERLINNIFDGFILLAIKNRKNQEHFNELVADILKEVIGNYKLGLTLTSFLTKIAELSPRAFLDFLQSSIKTDKENFLHFIQAKAEHLYSVSFVYYIINAIEVCLKEEGYAHEALKCLLCIYDLSPDKELEEEIIKCLSIIATMNNSVAIPFNQKVDIFFKHIENSKPLQYEPIVKMLHEGGAQHIITTNRPSFKLYARGGEEVTYQDVFNMQYKALSWLLSIKEEKSYLGALKGILQNIRRLPYQEVKKQIDSFLTELQNISEDSIKAQMHIELLKTKESILKYEKGANYQRYISLIDTIKEELKINDLYEQAKIYILNDRFPLENPPKEGDLNAYEKECEQRKELREEWIQRLVKSYGEDIFERIVRDSENRIYNIWGFIFQTSSNHERDISNLIKYGCEIGLRYYLSCIDGELLGELLKNYSESKEILLKNMP